MQVICRAVTLLAPLPRSTWPTATGHRRSKTSRLPYLASTSHPTQRLRRTLRKRIHMTAHSRLQRPDHPCRRGTRPRSPPLVRPSDRCEWRFSACESFTNPASHFLACAFPHQHIKYGTSRECCGAFARLRRGQRRNGGNGSFAAHRRSHRAAGHGSVPQASHRYCMLTAASMSTMHSVLSALPCNMLAARRYTPPFACRLVCSQVAFTSQLLRISANEVPCVTAGEAVINSVV